MKNSPKINKGFTLIELVVVMAIIAVLAALMTAAIMGARVQSRNTKRVADARTFQIALELYSSKYGRYPTNCDDPSNPWGNGGMASIYATQNCDWGNPLFPDTARTTLEKEGFLPNFTSDPTDNRVRYARISLNQYSLYVVNEPRPSVGPGGVAWNTYNKYSLLEAANDTANTSNFSME